MIYIIERALGVKSENASLNRYFSTSQKASLCFVQLLKPLEPQFPPMEMGLSASENGCEIILDDACGSAQKF